MEGRNLRKQWSCMKWACGAAQEKVTDFYPSTVALCLSFTFFYVGVLIVIYRKGTPC